MTLISEIVAPRRGSRLRVLHADHEEWRRTSADVVKALGLRAGHIEPAEDLAARIEAAEPTFARDRAYRLLAYRDRTAHELRERLVEDGYPAALSAGIVADLTRVGLVDDDRYARTSARSLATVRGFGRNRILRELEAKGVDPGLAAAATTEALPEHDEEASALRLARALTSRPKADVARIATRLARKGFAPALALKTARRALAELADGDAPDLPVLDDWPPPER
ncbi:MAG: RecX family transcriptional regulator [Coriobacteriia bacterium]|nr:RecX family transcriptional regulator [Coriobacteriia bacterium]